MGETTTEEREAVKPDGAVLAQRLPNAGDKLFRLRGMQQEKQAKTKVLLFYVHKVPRKMYF